MTTPISPERLAEIEAHYTRPYSDPCKEARYGKETALDLVAEVRRLRNALESAEQERDAAVRELNRIKGDGECPHCGESYTLPEEACCAYWLVRQAENGVIGTEMYLEAVKDERDALKEALTPSTETKCAYMSEVKDDGRFVSWSAIKDIMRTIQTRANTCRASSEAAKEKG